MENSSEQNAESGTSGRVNVATEIPSDIIIRIRDLLMRYGARALTMDDVAGELGVSKKTLYKHFDNKRDMVRKAMLHHLGEEQETMEQICERSDNAIDEMIQIFRHVSTHLGSLNQAFLYDIQKYHPDAWSYLTDYKMSFVLRCVSRNLLLGVEQGLYRAEIDIEVLALLYMGRMDMFTRPDFFPMGRFDITRVYSEFMNYHIRGIATPKGVAYWEQNQPDAR